MEALTEADLSRFLTPASGLPSSFPTGWVSALFLEMARKTPVSIGDSDIGEVKAVGGSGFLRTGEEVCAKMGEAKVFKVAGGVGCLDGSARGGEREEPLGGKAKGFIAPRGGYQIDISQDAPHEGQSVQPHAR